MAKMFPEAIPREVLEDPKRSSERQVYKALRKQLDDGYHVFYSSPWLGTNPDGSEIDGEADFLVAHADKGMLSIEVKGGRVKILEDNRWTTTDRDGFTNYIKNPVDQARTSKHRLIKELKKSHRWESRFICIRHGVILNHSERESRDFRPDMPLKIFAFKEDMNHLDAWVEARFGSAEDSDEKVKSLGIDGIYALQDMLARKINLHVSLSTNVNLDMKDIQLRTDDQIFILEDMEEVHRMAIAGAAGTGKTILAMEKALMLAEEKKRVLLLCFNRPLGGYLKQKMEVAHTVTATHFHQYCRDVARAAGANPNDFTQAQLVDSLVDHFSDAALPPYDAVIIDEGQDFPDEWLTTLEVVVKDEEDGVLYIFYDDNQNVMSTNAHYIKQLPLTPHRLHRNFRNTKCIFEKAERYYQGKRVRPIGPKGIKPKYEEAKNEAELKIKLAERVGSLTRTEGIQSGDIAILFSDTEAASMLKDDKGYRVGKHRATDAEHRNPDQVCVDTIRRFKGLESPVILLVANGDTANTDELLYVGMTRAQAVLEVLGPAHVINKINRE